MTPVKQSLTRRPVDPHASAGTSSSGKSKVIREVTTNRMRKGRERTAIRLVRGQLPCVWKPGEAICIARPREASCM